MSHFMSSMPAAGLMLMPPVSNVTPLPMNAIGFAFAAPFFPLPLPAPCHCMIATRGSCALPCDTPSSAPNPSFVSSLRPSTSTSSPSFSSASMRLANSGGVSTFGGSLTRSRVRNTPSATAGSGAHACSTLAGSVTSSFSVVSRGFSSSFSLVR